MVEPRNEPQTPSERGEIARVAQEVAARLRASGIDVSDSDSPDQLVRLLDAVESFERSVQRRGGDLMVDEPLPDERGEPDDPLYLLPTRAEDESVDAYIQRLEVLTNQIRTRRPLR